ncbi:MAG: type VI secretion system membrane subunit TssM [Pseudomonadota bacterium]
MRFFKNWWFITITITLIMIGLFCFGLPLVWEAVDPLWVRLTIGFTLVFIWALATFLRWRKAKKAAEALERELAGPDLAGEESQKLKELVKQALGDLKKEKGRGGNYLYDRPWYLMIGPPGAGKTTALLNSGLQFPDAVIERQKVQQSGTRNLEFLGASEAVLIDTAGRYTTQDSDRDVDSAGWNSFLELLKKHRPLQPINGVIVAIRTDELIAKDSAGIDEQGRIIRRRLMELRTKLEADIPVYVMLTMADTMAGFVEFFADLDVEGRRAVLGSTLPINSGASGASAVRLDELTQAFDRMAQAINDRKAKRLEEEPDPMRRSLMIGFPSQLQALRTRLMWLLKGIFVEGQESPGMLRGFYLTSGVQQGTPLDRILSGMAHVYDTEPRVETGTAGRAYFLNRLLTQVVFEEAGLVTMDARARTRQRAILAGVIGAIGALTLVILTLWGISTVQNQAYQAEVLAATSELESEIAAAGINMAEYNSSAADLQAVRPYLNKLRDLPGGFRDQEEGNVPWSMGFGLYDSDLADDAEEAYRDALRRIMLPRILDQIEGFLRSGSVEAIELYEPLKAYLMLGRVEEEAVLDKDAVKSWLVRDWAFRLFPGADSTGARTDLEKHLEALLDDPNLEQVWPDNVAPVDARIIASARQRLTSLNLAERSYAVMKQSTIAEGGYWLAETHVSSGDALAFKSPEAVLDYRIPELFTRDGFTVFTNALQVRIQSVRSELWVFGEQNEGGLLRETASLEQGIKGLYAADYIAAWNGLLESLEPADYFNNADAFSAITKGSSGLQKVLTEVRRNTIFEGGVEGLKEDATRKITDRLGVSRAAQRLSDNDSGIQTDKVIENAFADLHEFVGDGESPAPLDSFIAALKEAKSGLATAELTGGGLGVDSGQAAASRGTAELLTASDSAPPQLREFAKQVFAQSRGEQISSATGAISENYAQSVLPGCQEVAQERYPFLQSAEADAQPGEMQRVFGRGGTIDSFVTNRLTLLVDSSGPIWRWREDEEVTKALDPQSPQEFARAIKIRDFLDNGLEMSVSVDAFGDEVSEVELFTGNGIPVSFTSESDPARTLAWTLGGGVPEAYVVLKGIEEATEDEPEQEVELRRFEGQGRWALFRMIADATTRKPDPRRLLVRFGQQPQSVVLAFQLRGGTDPFSAQGLWSFRCPAAL